MTYFNVLALFIGPPLALLLLWTVFDARRGKDGMGSRLSLLVLLTHVALALIYTTPWDNYLVATGVWWYDPTLVIGLTLGWVPIEEYVFFVVQTLLTGLWLLTLRRYIPSAKERSMPRLRYTSLAVVGLIWIISIFILLSGWHPGTYLGLELAWGLLPMMIQLAYGADILWSQHKVVLLAILVPTVYLYVADALAIGTGTWTIDPAQSTGIMMAGVLPVEEMIFFLLTNVLIVSGMILMLSERSRVLGHKMAVVWRRRDAEVTDYGL